MADDQTYDDGRAQRLLALLRALAARIEDLRAHEDLRDAGPELMKLMGDARSELFHYEVRCTYDTPEVAESRRIVERAKRQSGELELPGGHHLDLDDSEEDLPWQQ